MHRGGWLGEILYVGSCEQIAGATRGLLVRLVLEALGVRREMWRMGKRELVIRGAAGGT
jgi:hypothetical protein